MVDTEEEWWGGGVVVGETMACNGLERRIDFRRAIR